MARTVRLNTRVEKVARSHDANGWVVETGEGERIDAGGVCVALPAYAAARLLMPALVSLACAYAVRQRPDLVLPLIFVVMLSLLAAVIWIAAGASKGP